MSLAGSGNVVTVTTTADDGSGSLRLAIAGANGSTTVDAIEFDISDLSGSVRALTQANRYFLNHSQLLRTISAPRRSLRWFVPGDLLVTN